MKRFTLFGIGTLVVLLIVSYAFAHQAMNPGMMSGQTSMDGSMSNNWFGRLMGSWMGMWGMHSGSRMMDRGMMEQDSMMENRMMEQGSMMKQGSMMGQGMTPDACGWDGGFDGWWGPPDSTTSLDAPVNEAQATELAQRYVDTIGNPNLRVGETRESDTDFEVEIVTSNGSPVDKLLIDKDTGWLRSTYRPFPGRPQNADQARAMVERMIGMNGNPNLVPGDAREVDQGFEVEIRTRDGEIVGTVPIRTNESQSPSATPDPRQTTTRRGNGRWCR